MTAIIDLGAELLINQSQVNNPELRLLLAAIGEPIARNSPWVAVAKCIAGLYPFPPSVFRLRA